MRVHTIGWLAACVTAVFAANPALAADLPVPVAEPVPMVVTQGGWSFSVAPYGWLAGIEGDVAEFGLPSVHVNASFTDILDHLDAVPFMAVAEARYNRFGMVSDLIYVKIAGARATPFGLLAQKVSLSTTTFTAMGAAEFRVSEGPMGSFDVFAGARYWSVDTKVSLSGGLLGTRSVSESQSWVDPLVGVKARLNFSPKWYLTAWGMVGGFGASSEFMWDALAGVGYSFNDRISMVAGYRALGVDYKSKGFVFDVVQHGPILGAVFRF